MQCYQLTPMVTMMILHAKQQERHRWKEQTFGLCGRRREWVDLREVHWNMYITLCKTDDQCKFDAWSRAPKASALGQFRVIGWGERWEEGSGWGDTCLPVAYSCWCMSIIITISSVHSLSRVLLCDPVNCSMQGPPVHHQLPEFTQTHVH